MKGIEIGTCILVRLQCIVMLKHWGELNNISLGNRSKKIKTVPATGLVNKMDKFDLIANLLEAGLEPVVEKILLLLPLPCISQFSQVCR